MLRELACTKIDHAVSFAENSEEPLETFFATPNVFHSSVDLPIDPKGEKLYKGMVWE